MLFSTLFCLELFSPIPALFLLTGPACYTSNGLTGKTGQTNSCLKKIIRYLVKHLMSLFGNYSIPGGS